MRTVLAEISAEGWGVIIAAFFAGLMGMVGAITNLIVTVKGNRKADTDRAQIKQTLTAATQAQKKQLDGIAVVAGKTEKLVNSAKGETLSTGALAARQLAELTKSPVHLEAADLAEKKLAEHEANQAVVDAGG